LIYLLPLIHLENHVCLYLGLLEAVAAWRVAMRIIAGVGDLVQRIGDGRTGRVLGGRAIVGSGAAVCRLHRVCEDEESGFLG
jgi:hypothetical protein